MHGISPLRPRPEATNESTQLETALCDDIAKACLRKLIFNDRLPH